MKKLRHKNNKKPKKKKVVLEEGSTFERLRMTTSFVELGVQIVFEMDVYPIVIF